MGAKHDYYDVLGVGRDATGDEIKRAFRALARRLHPDVAAGADSESFHDVVAAYEVLSHPRRRSLYDRLGFGSRRRPAARPAPAVPPIEVELTWFEAQRGVAKPLEFDETLACAQCGGRGHARGVRPAECIRCRGTGRLSTLRESATLRLLEVRACPSCEGRGHEPAPACSECEGSGRTTALRCLRVRVPAGVRDGDLIQVEGIERRFRLNVAPRPRDSRLVLGAAGAAFLCALGLLLFLTAR